MKAYEKRLLLEKERNWARYKMDRRESHVGHLKGQLKILEERNRRMEIMLKDEILGQEKDLADLFDYHKGKVEALKAFKRVKPTADVTPVNENGKKVCEICGDEFASQGFPAHQKKCLRIHELEKELSTLEEE